VSYQEDFNFYNGPDFDDGAEAPYQEHSATSREAAELIEPDAATLRGVVLEYIRRCGRLGATDDEVQVALDMNPSTQRPRRVELWKADLIERTNVKRLTRSGRKASVWVAREVKHVASTAA
jgi:hypothetical protein